MVLNKFWPEIFGGRKSYAEKKGRILRNFFLNEFVCYMKSNVKCWYGIFIALKTDLTTFFKQKDMLRRQYNLHYIYIYI